MRAGTNKKGIAALSESIGRKLTERDLTLAAAESCTGGLMSSLITDIPGSSDYFAGAVVAYSNKVKVRPLGVSPSTLKRLGAVSEAAAREMVLGVRKMLGSDLGVSITGIAGPGGGSAEKPVGTVFIGISDGKKTIIKKFSFKGTRLSIKRQSASKALSMLLSFLKPPRARSASNTAL